MITFAPPECPVDAPAWFRKYHNDLCDAIKKASSADAPFTRRTVLHAEPSRYFAGMEVYADGTDWNPGSGEGVYRRNAANSAWVFIG